MTKLNFFTNFMLRLLQIPWQEKLSNIIGWNWKTVSYRQTNCLPASNMPAQPATQACQIHLGLYYSLSCAQRNKLGTI